MKGTAVTTPPLEGWSKDNHAVARKAGYDSWDAFVEATAQRRGKAICGARNRAGSPCGREAGWGTAHLGNGRCKLHGGNMPVGAAAPAYKHGRYSQAAIPDDILRARLNAHEDPRLLSLAEQIATVNAKEERVLARLAEAEAEAEPNPKAQAALWESLLVWADHKRRLVETETKLRVAHHDMLTRDRLRVLVDYVSASLRDAVEEHVSDSGERRRVLTTFAHRLRRFYLEAPNQGGKNG